VAGMVVEQVDGDGSEVRIWVRSRQVHAACPDCETMSAGVHSRYQRRLTDRPISGRPDQQTPSVTTGSPSSASHLTSNHHPGSGDLPQARPVPRNVAGSVKDRTRTAAHHRPHLEHYVFAPAILQPPCCRPVHPMAPLWAGPGRAPPLVMPGAPLLRNQPDRCHPRSLNSRAAFITALVGANHCVDRNLLMRSSSNEGSPTCRTAR
jgi:hypothetical protein